MSDNKYSSLDDWFESIKKNAKEALVSLSDFKFDEVRYRVESILHFCDKIRPHDCSWCGQAHKTENCLLRSEDGGFYHKIAYRVWKDREERVMKQAWKIFCDDLERRLGQDEYEKLEKGALKKTLLREKKGSKLFELLYNRNLADELLERLYELKAEEAARAVKAKA